MLSSSQFSIATVGLPASAVALFLLALYSLYGYFFTYSKLRSIPGPLSARFSSLWYLRTALKQRVLTAVQDAHRKHGPVVRIEPNHVSFTDDAAIPVIYSDGKFLKTDFYNFAKVGGDSIFSTSDRAVHTRKRRLISHAFSSASIHQFEPIVAVHLAKLIEQLDGLIERGQTTEKKNQTSPVNIMNWFNYMTYDVIADLAFGKPMGMLAAGSDVTEMRASLDGPAEYFAPIRAMEERNVGTAIVAIMPSLINLRHWNPEPQSRKRAETAKKILGMTIAQVKQRVENPPVIDRKDLLSRMMEARDDYGQQLSTEELYPESIAMLIAGSETTSTTLSTLCYYLVTHPAVLVKLREEVDAAVPEDVEIPTHAMTQSLPYLNMVIKEALRLNSLVGMGLPRKVPQNASGGVTISGHFIPSGTVVSVPAYCLQLSPEIWGPDALSFRPERWEQPTATMKRAFIPFSVGPRACIGRNLAEMELQTTTALWVRRYNVELQPGQGELDYGEGFLRKPSQLLVTIGRR